MAASYRIDVGRRTIFSKADGIVTDDDLRGHQRSILQDPEFDPSFDQLWDLLAVEQVEVSNEALRDLAQARSYTPRSRRAIVASQDVAYGMARMFQMLHAEAPETVEVFRSQRDAEQWLGLQ